MTNPTTVSAMTPGGMGAMAVVRLAGDGAVAALGSMFASHSGVAPESIEPDRLTYGRFVDRSDEKDPANGETLDDGIVVVRPDARGGHSVDMTVHGSPRVVERLCLLAKRAGAVLDPHPSEVRSTWTTIDAEVASALARAKTRRAVRFIARQRTTLPAELERIATAYERSADEGRTQLARLIERSRRAQTLIDEAQVVFTGPTNAGKSTLINRLFDRARSLVSPQPGTTRDWVDAEVAIDGIPLRVFDTAGWRERADALETDAIARGLEQLRNADAQVIVLDGSAPFPTAFLNHLHAHLDPNRAIIAMNKADHRAAWRPDRLPAPGSPVIATSGLTGEGASELRATLSQMLSIVEDATLPTLLSAGHIDRMSQLLSDEAGPICAQKLRRQCSARIPAESAPS